MQALNSQVLNNLIAFHNELCFYFIMQFALATFFDVSRLKVSAFMTMAMGMMR